MSSYVPTDWVDGSTPLDATHFDNMEAELVLLDSLKVPDPTGLDEKWLKVEGGAMLWVDPPAGGGGGGLDWEGAWAGATPYVKGDVVTYNGVTYGAVNDSTGQTPPAAAASGALPVIPLVTSLPATPFDGQEVVLTDSLTAGTYHWRLRYVAAKSSNKWVFVGGTPLYAGVVPAAVSTTSTFTTYVSLTGGPSVVAPVAGAYRVSYGCRLYNSAAGAFATANVKNGANAAVQDDMLWFTSAGANYDVALSRTVKFATVAASATIEVVYARGSATGTASFAERWIELFPVAVGG